MTFSSQWETNPYKNSKLISLFLHSDFSLITTPGYIRSETFRSTYAIKSFCFVWWFFFLYFENIILQPSTYFSFWWFLFEMKRKYYCIDIKASTKGEKNSITVMGSLSIVMMSALTYWISQWNNETKKFTWF